MALSRNQKRYLVSLSHNVHPTVMVGKAGATETVMEKLNDELHAHELVKIKLIDEDRDARKAAMQALHEGSGADMVLKIGKIFVLYKARKKKPEIVLPKN